MLMIDNQDPETFTMIKSSFLMNLAFTFPLPSLIVQPKVKSRT